MAGILLPTWQYKESQDSMGGGRVKTALVRSLNKIEFDFPYQAPQRAILALRVHPRHGKDIVLNLQKAHFMCDLLGCQVTIRFDDGPPRDYRAVTPADHSTNTLFIRGFDRFVSQARKAKKAYIEASFYLQGSRVFEFDVSGLKFP